VEISWRLSGHGKMSNGGERVVDQPPILAGDRGCRPQKNYSCRGKTVLANCSYGLAFFFRRKTTLLSNFSINSQAPPEIAGGAAILGDGAPGELQPIGMFLTAAISALMSPRLSKVGKTHVFSPASSRASPDRHRKILLKAGPKFFGV